MLDEKESLEELLSLKRNILEKIKDNWNDETFLLTRNRYEIHDSLIKELREIDERLARHEV